jgi:hypothetical protein
VVCPANIKARPHDARKLAVPPAQRMSESVFEMHGPRTGAALLRPAAPRLLGQEIDIVKNSMHIGDELDEHDSDSCLISVRFRGSHVSFLWMQTFAIPASLGNAHDANQNRASSCTGRDFFRERHPECSLWVRKPRTRVYGCLGPSPSDA